MGNRAMITTAGANLGVYLHWNGGRDSVEAFLRWAELANLPPLRADGRGFTSFVTVLCNFVGNDGRTVALEMIRPGMLTHDAPEDNGTYAVEGWQIVARHGAPTFEQHYHDLDEMLVAIDTAQPKKDQLGEYLRAKEVPTKSLSVGDQVWQLESWNKGERCKVYTVLGHGEDRTLNGYKVLGMPYLNMFENQDNANNINSYVRTETVRIPA